jgi:hypothetical protein
VDAASLSAEVARASVLWITSRRATVDGGRGREYEILTPDGDVLLVGSSSVWGREIVVLEPGTETPVLRLRRSRGFVFNGRVDVLAARETRMGSVHRSGRFRNASGLDLGRLRDARKLSSRFGEGVLQAVLDGALGLGGSDSQLSGPVAFVCTRDGRPVASLVVKKLPFVREEPVASDAARALHRVLPGPVRRWLLDRTDGRGWALEPAGAFPEEPLLFLSAALFAVELSHW